MLLNLVTQPSWTVLSRQFFADPDAPSDTYCAAIVHDSDANLIFVLAEHDETTSGALFSADWWYSLLGLLADRWAFEAIGLDVPAGSIFCLCDGEMRWTFGTEEQAITAVIDLACESLGFDHVG